MTQFGKEIRTAALIGKYRSRDVAESLRALSAFLRGRGLRVVVEEGTAASIGGTEGFEAASYEVIGDSADIAVVLGGDGTMLHTARRLAEYDVPLVGVNQGRLGFMTDIPLDRMMPLLADMLAGKVESEQRGLLEGSVWRDGESIVSSVAFNDIVVSRGAGSGMIELRVEVDGHFMYNQRSDGLIVATPTGSTAYALSAGGPLLHPSLTGIGLVPIAPHALSNRPIVVPDSSEIVIEVISGRDSSVNFDMQLLASLAHHDRIVIRRSAHKITFLHPQGWSYYDTLREKLHWNEYPSLEGQLK